MGKSSILARFTDDTFETACQSTVGSDLITRTVHILQNQQQQQQQQQVGHLRLQIWDTAGQQRFRSLLPSHIKDTSVAVVVYDVTNRASFDSVGTWIDCIRTEERRGDDDTTTCTIFLVGNKADIGLVERAVTPDEGLQTARKFPRVVFLEVSARSGYNVRYLFSSLSIAIVSPPPPAAAAAAQTTTTTAGRQRLPQPVSPLTAVHQSPTLFRGTTTPRGSSSMEQQGGGGASSLDASASSWSNFFETVHKSLI